MLKDPLFWAKKAGHRANLRHGTKQFRTLPVSEQVVRTISPLQFGWSQLMNEPQYVPSQGWRFRNLLIRNALEKLYWTGA